jgi:putative mRNA 3-end processing factor
VSLHPAGHIIGSAQVRVEYRGEVWVYSGDYKRQPDPFAPAFEVVPCHTFITETTFGLPLYAWPDVDDVRTDINAWWRWHAERETVCVVQVYPLGKAQRLMGMIDTSIGPIVAHGSIHAMNSVLASAGHALPTWRELLPTTPAALLKGALILSSAQRLDFLPSNLGVAHAAASGWMALASRRAAYDAAFVVSDHVDWRGILDTIADTGAERVITTHGYADVVARYLQEQGLDAASQQDASQDATSQQDASQDASQDAAQDASQDATSQQDASHDAAAQH